MVPVFQSAYLANDSPGLDFTSFQSKGDQDDKLHDIQVLVEE